MEGVRTDVNSWDQGWLIGLHYNAHLGGLAGPTSTLPCQGFEGPQDRVESQQRECTAEQKCLLQPGQEAWENVQPTSALSALVASALKARRQAGILAISCSRIIEAITWDLQRLTLKE